MKLPGSLNPEVFLSAGLQAYHSLAPNHGTMDGARRQIEPVTRMKGDLVILARQPEGDAAAYTVEDLVVVMVVRPVYIVRAVGPCVEAQSFGSLEGLQR
jgi:hypothetical protein